MAADPAYATLPVALFMLGSAGSILPLVLAMQKFGRKPIFLLASVIACAGGILAMVALVGEGFALYNGASVLMGIGLAAGQQYRFAAMESVEPAQAAGAASRVLLGGLVAAFLGPQLVAWGEHLFPVPFLGSFALLLFVIVLATLALLGYREPPRRGRDPEAMRDARPLRQILGCRPVLAAIGCGAAGFTVMSLVMTATPLHMHVVNGHSLEATKWVLQSHIAAMFAPALAVPWLVRRVGVSGLLALGIVAMVAVLMVVFAHFEFSHYWVGLVLLGLGWNFLFIGGTTLLATSYRPDEAFKVQAVNDVTLFGLQALAALGAGWLLAVVGWQALLLTAVPALVLAAVAVLNWRLRAEPGALGDPA